jgi:hypothetical protein
MAIGAETHREKYLFGGYLVTRRVARPESMSAELLPAELLTASACIASFVPDVWSLGWTQVSGEERESAAAALGLAPEGLSVLIDRVTAGFDDGEFGWPNVVKSSEALGELVRLLPDSSEWVVLGLGLHERHVPRFLEENAPAERQGAGGVYEVLAGQAWLPEGGNIRGFELLGFESGSQPHSWLCNGLERECFRVLGIRPNRHGFLETEGEAERATAYIARDDVGAEPALWLPWLIVDYTDSR